MEGTFKTIYFIIGGGFLKEMFPVAEGYVKQILILIFIKYWIILIVVCRRASSTSGATQAGVQSSPSCTGGITQSNNNVGWKLCHMFSGESGSSSVSTSGTEKNTQPNYFYVAAAAAVLFCIRTKWGVTSFSQKKAAVQNFVQPPPLPLLWTCPNSVNESFPP